MQLICRYYEDMEINIIDNREKLLNIIDEDYKINFNKSKNKSI